MHGKANEQRTSASSGSVANWRGVGDDCSSLVGSWRSLNAGTRVQAMVCTGRLCVACNVDCRPSVVLSVEETHVARHDNAAVD